MNLTEELYARFNTQCTIMIIITRWTSSLLFKQSFYFRFLMYHMTQINQSKYNLILNGCLY